MPSARLPPPLVHLRVVDLTDLRGALAGRIFADLGAAVIKVEPPGGDPDRLRPPFAGNVAAPDRSLPFLFRNLGKRRAVLDLEDADGWGRFVTLCDRADVLVENQDTGALGGRLSPAAIRARHPHLVHVSIADLGRSGPRAGWRLEPLPAFAASGALWASGFPDRAPCWLAGYQAHDCAAIVAVIGALVALLDRSARGLGQTVEVSVQEAGLASLDPWSVLFADYARVYPALPPAYPRDADGPALVVPAADGHVRLLAVTPRQWRALLALFAKREPPAEPTSEEGGHHVVGRGTWGLVGAGLDALAAQGLRAAGAAVAAMARLPLGGQLLPAVHAALGALRFLAGEALGGRPRAEVVAHGLRLGLPIAPVNTPEEFVAAEQTRARGAFQSMGLPPLGRAPVIPFPCRFSRTPVAVRQVPDGDEATFPPRAPSALSGFAPAGPVLAGIRVVNLGVGAVVPELCTMLADLGAEVVKIESAASLDFLRRLTLEPGRPNRSFMFNDENRGQKSVCLDLRVPAGRDLALRLCATADVVAENRQGGLVARLGLDYEDVRRVRPDVIYLSSQGYGRGGPLGAAPAFGPLAAAFAGATFLWNHPDAPYPAGSSLEHPDHVAGKLAAIAVLAALEHRRRTGEGQHVELAQTEAVAFLLGERYLEAPLTGRPARPNGNAVEYACPHGVYPAAGTDRWVAIAVVGDVAWERLCRALGWALEPRLATLGARLAVRAELDARVAAWTAGRDADAAAARLQSVGVSAMAVQGPEDLRADPHLAARGALVTIDDPEIGPIRHVANPLRFGRTPLAPPRPAPRLGADTPQVLARLLGLTPAEVARLVAEGVCR